MIFKDSLSIFSKNVSLLFKVLLYAAIILLVSMAILVAIVNPLIKEFSATFDFASKLKSSITLWLNGEVGTFSEFFQLVGNFLGTQGTAIAKIIIYAFILFFILKFLFGLTFIPITKVINSQMSQNYKEKYTTAMISSWGKSLLFALIYALITVPLDFAILTACYYLLKVLYPSLGFFAPTLAMSLLIALFSFRISLLSQWVPTIVCEDKKIFCALKHSFKPSLRLLKAVLPSIAILIITMYTAVMVTTLITFAILPIVVLPSIIIISNCVSLVSYYTSNGKEYYKN